MSCNQKPTTLIAAICLSLALVSCEPEDSNEWEVSNGEPIQEHLDEFVEQANLRGVEIRWRRVKFEYTDLGGVSGRSNRPKYLIQLDTTVLFWEHNQQKVIWHELGHYLLNRKHVQDTIQLNGILYERSIMSSGVPIFFDNLPEEVVNYYWDELFEGQ